MLLAKKQPDNSFEIYISLIDNISQNEEVIGKYFESILSQTKQLVDNEIDYYQVDPETYSIVSFLASHGKEYIKSIKANKIEKKDLLALKDILMENMAIPA